MLLSIPGKVLSRIMLERLKAALDKRLREEQAGFRQDRSCTDHIATMRIIIEQSLEWQTPLYSIFVDFQKAFDWVNRDLLLYKLSTSYDIHGRLFNILSTIYKSSNAQIKINGLYTESFSVTSGVRQGDIVSPILFSMYLNDLASGIKDLNCGIQIEDINISILLYADDIVLIGKDEKSIQKMLNFTTNWCKKWRMSINSDKTQIVHFRNSSMPQSSYAFYFESQPLRTVDHYKYLGVIFDENLNFDMNEI